MVMRWSHSLFGLVGPLVTKSLRTKGTALIAMARDAESRASSRRYFKQIVWLSGQNPAQDWKIRFRLRKPQRGHQARVR